MGMPITVEIEDTSVTQEIMDQVFDYFRSIDEQFSVYKTTSEITKINDGLIPASEASKEMRLIFDLCEETKQATSGYFDIRDRNGRLDPSGIVKGWAIYEASKLLKKLGMNIFFVDVGGDIQVSGKRWDIGIKHPFDQTEIVKVMHLEDRGVATSGTYIRGQHIYDPFAKDQHIDEIVSLTVIGPNVHEADRFATAAFAMKRKGIEFIEGLPGFEGYMIDRDGIATMTSGFEQYT